MFLACVVFVVPHKQDRTAEAQTFQRMHHQRWVGRAAERCLDATTSSVVCVGVGVCVPKSTTSTGLAGQPNCAWMTAARCLDGTSSVVCVGVGVCAGLAGQPNGAWTLVAVSGGGNAPHHEPTPPGPTQCALEGPSPVCVRKSTCKIYVIDFYKHEIVIFQSTICKSILQYIRLALELIICLTICVGARCKKHHRPHTNNLV